MPGILHPFISVGLLSVGVSLAVGAVAWRQRGSRGAGIYAVLMVLLGVWSMLYVVQLRQPTVADKRFWIVGRHALTPLVGVLFWLFAARYTDRQELLSMSYLVPILVGGVLVTAASVLNPGDLYWEAISLYTGDSVQRARITFGPLFWGIVLYIVAVVGGGHGYIVLYLLNSFGVYRRQLSAMAVAGVFEFVLMFLFLSDHLVFLPSLNPWPYLQLITYNMVFVAVPLGWSYFRESLFELQPLNRQAVIENMEDAVFVFDPNDRLRNCNDPARQLVQTDGSGSLEGSTAEAVFEEQPILLETYQADRGEATAPESTESDSSRVPELDDVTGKSETLNELVRLPTEEGTRYYDIRVSPIRSSTGDRVGTVVVARDVTVRRRQREMLSERTAELADRTEQLERQNERLNKFASMVSHDLRNPLTVAKLRTNLVVDEYDDEHAEAVQNSLERMETMIDEMLTMARAGQTIEEAESCLLSNVVREAWGNVERTEGTLDCQTEQTTVEADYNRLLHVFENLFRNALDHNDPPLRVVVGCLDADDGFYVADDGSGIPEDERQNVFDYGYSTTENGSGYGLAIVNDVVDAHGWRIDTTESENGGARFEIRTD